MFLADGAVACEDEQGTRFPDYVEVSEELERAGAELSEKRRQLEEANAKAAAEAAARVAAEEQLRTLTAELRRLRGED